MISSSFRADLVTSMYSVFKKQSSSFRADLVTSMYSVFKKQSQLLLAQRHESATKCSNFRQQFKKQLRVWLWLCLPHHLCNNHTSWNVLDKLHFGNKQQSKSKNHKYRNLLRINLTQWTMNPSQNLLKMSTVSPDTSRETATPLTDGCNNNWMVKLCAFN